MAGPANEKQVGGDHYKKHGTELQHWDIVRMFDLGYLIGNATKYLFRWRNKNGVEDLKKAIHYIEKQIEEIEAEKGPEVPDADDYPEEFEPFETAHTITVAGARFVRLDKLSSAELLDEVMLRESESERRRMDEYARSQVLIHGPEADDTNFVLELGDTVDVRPRCGTCEAVLPAHTWVDVANGVMCKEANLPPAPVVQRPESPAERWQCGGCGASLDEPGNGHGYEYATLRAAVLCPVDGAAWHRKPFTAPSAAAGEPAAPAPLGGL